MRALDRLTGFLVLALVLAQSHYASAGFRPLLLQVPTDGADAAVSPVADKMLGGQRKLQASTDIQSLSLGVQDVSMTYQYAVCKHTEVYNATSTEEVQQIIASLKDSNKTIRAVSHFALVGELSTSKGSHSSATFACPSTNVDSSDVDVIIALDIAGIIGQPNPLTGQITVGASMELYTLAVGYLESLNLSIPTMAFPYHASLTVGGVFAAGSHGAYTNFPGLLIDMVTCVKYIDGKANIRQACRGDPETGVMFTGLAGGIGLLGVVTELTIQAVPNTKTRVETLVYTTDDTVFSDIQALKANPAYDSLFVFWRPDTKNWTAIVTSTLPYDTPVNPAGDPYPPNSDLTQPTGPFCVLTTGISSQNYSDLATALTVHNGPGGLTAPFDSSFTVNNKLRSMLPYTVTPVWAAWLSVGIPMRLEPVPDVSARNLTGRTNYMSMSSPCALTPSENGYLCFYAPSPSAGVPDLTFLDTEYAVQDDPKVLKDIIADLRHLVDKDLAASVEGFPGVVPIMPFGAGVLLRWSKQSDTLLGMNGAGPVMWIGMEHFQPLLTNDKPFPNRNAWITDIMEQRFQCRYKGRPHWGKCRDRAFTNPKCLLKARLSPQLQQFADLQSIADPNKIFEAPLFSKMLQANNGQDFRSQVYFDGCDPAGKCFCEEDSHCAAKDGGPRFQCVKSLAFPEHKACKPPPGF